MENESEEDRSSNKLHISFIEERYSFAQKEQWVQKVFMVGMGIFLILGLLGFFGSGYLSKKVFSADNFDIEYHQFTREETTTSLLIHLKGSTNTADTTTVSINEDYYRDVRIEQVVPDPASVEIRASNIYFTFNTTDTGTILFYLKPERLGTKTLEIGIQDEREKLHQFVFF